MTEMITRGVANAGFDDEADELPIRPLTRDEAEALRVKSPQVSPWRVIVAQVLVGGVVTLGVWGFSDQPGAVQSALYGAIVAVLPGALLARGMTSRLSSVSIGSSAVSVMLWSMVKIGVSIAMLMLAPKLVQSLSWPALLATLVLCMQMYWVALLWRGR
ncbi:MAG: ATP synthase subunit I [Rhizobacter sp.]|jgi:ATP synthase protein I